MIVTRRCISDSDRPKDEPSDPAMICTDMVLFPSPFFYLSQLSSIYPNFRHKTQCFLESSSLFFSMVKNNNNIQTESGHLPVGLGLVAGSRRGGEGANGML